VHHLNFRRANGGAVMPFACRLRMSVVSAPLALTRSADI